MSSGAAASRFFTESPEPRKTTSWPSRSSSSERRATYSLTSFRVPRRCGVTCAIERRSADTPAAYEPALDGPPAQASVFASTGSDLVAPATGVFERAYLAMNSSVCSRASSSGRWLCGDFIR